MSHVDTYPPLEVHVVGGTVDIGDKRPKEYRLAHRTIILNAANSTFNIAGFDPARHCVYINPVDNPIVLCSSTSQASDPANTNAPISISPSQPAVPATGVAQQNVNQVPVQVVISPNGATITNVSVNGVTVGTAAGTYTVPANGSISIAYSVATPTWVWSFVTPQFSSLGLTTPNGRILLTNEEYEVPGPDELWIATNIYPSRVGITIVREI